MNSNNNDREILEQIKVLLQEQVMLFREFTNKSEEYRIQSERMMKDSLARSKSNWRLYRIVISLVFAFFAFSAYFMFSQLNLITQ
jgi:hypothetical protein